MFGRILAKVSILFLASHGHSSQKIDLETTRSTLHLTAYLLHRPLLPRESDLQLPGVLLLLCGGGLQARQGAVCGLFRLRMVEFKSLSNMMRIEGLGMHSLPPYLRKSETDSTNNVEGEDVDNYSTKPSKIVVPSKQAARYNQANSVAQRIIAMAKKDGKVFEMVMPQLDHIYQNCMLVRDSKGKGKDAQDTLSIKQQRVAFMPPPGNRASKDHVNLANKKRKAS